MEESIDLKLLRKLFKKQSIYQILSVVQPPHVLSCPLVVRTVLWRMKSLYVKQRSFQLLWLVVTMNGVPRKIMSL